MNNQCLSICHLTVSRNNPSKNLKLMIYLILIVFIFIGLYRKEIFKIITEYAKPAITELSFTEMVRRNIEELKKDYDVIHMQPETGPVRPFVNIYSHYPTARSYNLTACYVPKVLSTTLGSIFCYLSNTTGFKEEGLDMRTLYWGKPFCVKNRPTLGSTAQLRDLLPRNTTSFVVVRNPIDRFISAFVNKCVDELQQTRLFNLSRTVCFDCNDDIECVVKNMYEASMNVSRTGHWEGSVTPAGYAMIHFNPLTWNCDMSFRYADTQFIKYASHGEEKLKMAEDMLNIMEKAGVEEYKLEEIKSVLLEDKPLTHATKGTSAPQKYREIIYNSPEILETLTNLYYYDFKIFGFAVPELGQLP